MEPPTGSSHYVTVDDYERPAREALDPAVYDFIAGGAGDEWTLARNRRDFARWRLRPRALRAIAEADLTGTLLGSPLALPVLVAPWAYQTLAHSEGEIATARAAAEAGTVMVVSSTAYERIEEIAAAAGVAWWQVYVHRDRGFTADLLARAAVAGYAAVCWTVDLPVIGLRHRDSRHGFEPPGGLDPVDRPYDPLISWDDLAWIRSCAPGLPVVVKGVLTAEDAELAVQAGADGIVVSNHGGRQLDFAPSAIAALPEVVAQVAGRVSVLMDGGVRTGVDVLKALALGAAAVMVGRAAAWGLAAEGEAGVAGVLGILRDELDTTMVLAGCRSLADIGDALVAPVDHPAT
jgi:isopentenyl diphosphate isomerase/L-lactate dehydrogenase-like FMN-dependent dehydrogenase